VKLEGSESHGDKYDTVKRRRRFSHSGSPDGAADSDWGQKAKAGASSREMKATDCGTSSAADLAANSEGGSFILAVEVDDRYRSLAPVAAPKGRSDVPPGKHEDFSESALADAKAFATKVPSRPQSRASQIDKVPDPDLHQKRVHDEAPTEDANASAP
jgi:hypothetical protein